MALKTLYVWMPRRFEILALFELSVPVNRREQNLILPEGIKQLVRTDYA